MPIFKPAVIPHMTKTLTGMPIFKSAVMPLMEIDITINLYTYTIALQACTPVCLCYVYVCVCVCVHGGAVSLSSYKCISVRVYAFVCLPVCFVLNITPAQCQVPVRAF